LRGLVFGWEDAWLEDQWGEIGSWGRVFGKERRATRRALGELKSRKEGVGGGEVKTLRVKAKGYFGRRGVWIILVSAEGGKRLGVRIGQSELQAVGSKMDIHEIQLHTITLA